MALPAPFLLGPWLADPAANELVRDGEAVRVEPKMMEVLVVLAERAGQTVTRDDLLDRVWPEVVVTEDALSGTISKLRRVLGDDARRPDFIETIPRTGYRLVAAVKPVAEPDPASDADADWAQPRAPAASARPRTLGILAAVGLATVLLLVWGLQHASPQEPEPRIRPVTRASGVERYPALDASGQRLAFAARARDSTFYHLFVQHLDAETPLQLTRARADDVQPAWSPDGQAVAFLRCLRLRCQVYSVPVLGGSPRRRAEATVSPYGLGWLSREAVIVVDRDSAAAPYQLLRLDLGTGKRTALTFPPPGTLGDLAPTLGPNGTVAFVRHGSGGDEDLYLLARDAREPTRLTDEHGRILGFGWDTDTGDLVFSDRRSGTVGLWRVAATGGAISQAIAPGLRDPGMLDAQGGRIVAESRTVEVNLWEAVRSADGSYQARSFLVSATADREPALSSAGDRIAFVSDRSGTPELWVADRDGSGLLRLTDFGGTGLGAPAWLPGGRIAFEVQRDGRADIYVVGAEGGTPQPLTDAAGYDVAPRPSRDGRWVYFGSDRSGRWEVWKVPLAGGAAVQVTSEGGFVAQESPDGRTLYFTRYLEPGLWVMPTEGGASRRVLDSLSYVDWGNWSITEAGLFWLDRTVSPARLLHRSSPDDDAADLVHEIDDVPMREVGLAASVDGGVLVLARIRLTESDLVLIEPR